MNSINIDKIREEVRAEKLRNRSENDLEFKINKMISERTDNDKYMCFAVASVCAATDPDGRVLFAGNRTEYIFAKENTFRGMIELEEYRKKFPSASSITFETRRSGHLVCGDGVIPEETVVVPLHKL